MKVCLRFLLIAFALVAAAPALAQKDSVSDWSTTAGENLDVGGISLAEGMSPGDLNDALREMMAQLKANNASILPPGSTVAYAGSTAPSGWLLLNGDTLGSAASTATQKSDDYQTLYELIWNSMADAEAPVDGGRGASANADWTANKKITMPDARGRAVFGLETTATNLTVAVAGFDGNTLGKTGGSQLVPNHVHTGGATAASPSGSIGSGGDAYTQAAGTGNPTGTGTGGTTGNLPPAIILNRIIKY